LLRLVSRDFGRPNAGDHGDSERRWRFVNVRTPEPRDNAWVIDFEFRDPHDAMMFALKYLGK
jgi:hypothetical protein